MYALLKENDHAAQASLARLAARLKKGLHEIGLRVLRRGIGDDDFDLAKTALMKIAGRMYIELA